VGQMPHGRSMIQYDDDDDDDSQAVSFEEDDDSGSMEVGKGFGTGSNLGIGGLGRGGHGGVGGLGGGGGMADAYGYGDGNFGGGADAYNFDVDVGGKFPFEMDGPDMDRGLPKKTNALASGAAAGKKSLDVGAGRGSLVSASSATSSGGSKGGAGRGVIASSGLPRSKVMDDKFDISRFNVGKGAAAKPAAAKSKSKMTDFQKFLEDSDDSGDGDSDGPPEQTVAPTKQAGTASARFQASKEALGASSDVSGSATPPSPLATKASAPESLATKSAVVGGAAAAPVAAVASGNKTVAQSRCAVPEAPEVSSDGSSPRSRVASSHGSRCPSPGAAPRATAAHGTDVARAVGSSHATSGSASPAASHRPGFNSRADHDKRERSPSRSLSRSRSRSHSSVHSRSSARSARSQSPSAGSDRGPPHGRIMQMDDLLGVAKQSAPPTVVSSVPPPRVDVIAALGTSAAEDSSVMSPHHATATYTEEFVGESTNQGHGLTYDDDFEPDAEGSNSSAPLRRKESGSKIVTAAATSTSATEAVAGAQRASLGNAAGSDNRMTTKPACQDRPGYDDDDYRPRRPTCHFGVQCSMPVDVGVQCDPPPPPQPPEYLRAPDDPFGPWAMPPPMMPTQAQAAAAYVHGLQYGSAYGTPLGPGPFLGGYGVPHQAFPPVGPYPIMHQHLGPIAGQHGFFPRPREPWGGKPREAGLGGVPSSSAGGGIGAVSTEGASVPLGAQSSMGQIGLASAVATAGDCPTLGVPSTLPAMAALNMVDESFRQQLDLLKAAAGRHRALLEKARVPLDG